MVIRQTKGKFKIAFIFMPLAEIRPPLSLTSLPSSVDLIMDEIARRIARSHDVIAYCARGEGQRKVEQFDDVEYRRMSTWLDRRLLNRRRVMRLIDLVRRQNGPQPSFSSELWYRFFIGEVIADVSRQDCDIVHIMNCSQFVPIIRARLPKIRIVLHMECQWLEHLDAAVIERRINAADLVLGCSNFIAAGMLVFPSVWQEPSGFPTFEAQACGLPVVSTFSGGIPEYVEDGRTGILVARGEARELALAIAQVRDNRELARAMGEAGRRRAIEHFSLDVMSRRLVDLIQSLSPADGGQNDILNGPNSANARRDAPGRPPIPYLRPRQNSLSVARFQARQLLKFFVPLISYRINGDNYGR